MSDQAVREQALNPQESFIVQAPAGSGKTELLTQRFLKLLCHTRQAPEEVVAITFTRKAAAEMRSRVIDALALAKGPEPTEAHKLMTYHFAKAVLKKDQEQHWELLDTPSRLRIMTLDSLASKLCHSTPLTSGIDPNTNISEAAYPLYENAADNLIISIHDNPSWKHPILKLLAHLDYRVDVLKYLFITILSNREQWLPHLISRRHDLSTAKDTLENALTQITQDALRNIASSFPSSFENELVELSHFAAHYCHEHDPDNPIHQLYGIIAIPNSDLAAKNHWNAIANLLLTVKGEWRKSINKRQGFPAHESAKPFKQRMTTLLQDLEAHEPFRRALFELTQCPPLQYKETQWDILSALMEVLPLLAAQLKLVFEEKETIDFTEINMAAHQALGDEDSPTTLAMQLDHQITHLLIDEFQDTSVMQFQLIEKLIHHWEAGDGRTLFLVGDPMQSIYRFRNAELGLFLHAKLHGIGHLPLTPLQLTRNFRSTSTVVEWINEHFSTIFPDQADIQLGAVPLTPSEAVKPHSRDTITWHTCIENTPDSSAKQIATIIQDIQAKEPDSTIAILVRSRNTLPPIIDALKAQQLAFKAVDIDPLFMTMPVQDAHTLVRAISHPMDHIAWYALLRTPFIGLSLNDCHAISQAPANVNTQTVWEKICSVTALSEDAQQRLNQIKPILNTALNQFGRERLDVTIQRLWKACHAEQCLRDQSAKDNVNAYFRRLETLCAKTPLPSIETIEADCMKLFAQPDSSAKNPVQIMTIHKSKGLEFDHVILPGLNQRTQQDKSQLLTWLERPRSEGGESDLILAPIKAKHDKQDPIYQYCRRFHQQKGAYEQSRLLYVAITRAIKGLHFVTSLKPRAGSSSISTSDQPIKPNSGSFLAMLWPSCELDIVKNMMDHTDDTHHNYRLYLHYYRLSSSAVGNRDSDVSLTQPLISDHQSIPSPLVIPDERPSLIGTLLHEALEKIGQHGVEYWSSENQARMNAYWRSSLRQYANDEIADHIQALQKAIENTLSDDRGRWIFSNTHRDIKNEYAITALLDNEPVQLILDRTFVDDTDTRWIIDYKTGNPKQFEQYIPQLKRYQAALALKESRIIKTALYYPEHQHWIEIV